MGTGRKVVYVLGAGASFGAGAYATVQHGGTVSIPTQFTFWRTFLKLCKSADRRKVIQSFLFKYFTEYNKVPSVLNDTERNKLLAEIDVEEVFTFISERVQAPATSPQMKRQFTQVWEALNIEIGYVFGRFQPNKKTKSIYKAFSRQHLRAHDTVISFNYDLIFERSLGKERKWGYHCITNTNKKLSIYKPHGSINWEVKHHDGKISVPRKTPDKPVIVAPTHLKFINSRPDHNNSTSALGYLNAAEDLSSIWREMEIELKMAKAIVFIGYSFPSADLYFSSLLRTIVNSQARKPTIILVNPDSDALGKRIKNRYSISTKNYFDLEQFNNIPRKDVLS
jgi:SIR2-like domain